MYSISRRCGKRLLPAAIMSVATSAFLLVPSLASAHAIAGDRVFPATMAVDDPGVGDEANFTYGHQRVPGDNGDQKRAHLLVARHPQGGSMRFRGFCARGHPGAE